MNFEEMGITIGSELLFNNGGEIAFVVSDRTVQFSDEETSLKNATRQALGDGYSLYVEPDTYWNYNGRILRDIYIDTHQKAE